MRDATTRAIFVKGPNSDAHLAFQTLLGLTIPQITLANVMLATMIMVAKSAKNAQSFVKHVH